MTISFVLKFVLIWKLCLEFDNFSRTFDKFLKTLFVLFSSTICKHLFLSFDLIICRKFFSFYYFLIFQHFCMFWLHINVLCTFTQTFKVWVEVFYYIYFSQETCEVKKKCEIFFHTWALRPKGFRTSNLIKRGIQNLALLQKVSNEQKISSLISGFIFGFIMSGTYFGHFRHQGVKISKCHNLIFAPN